MEKADGVIVLLLAWLPLRKGGELQIGVFWEKVREFRKVSSFARK